jgi:4-hydroxy-tetrahydrodipicolinate synthase
MHPLAGIYAAAVTPLGPDCNPDLNAIVPLLEFLAKRGCHGVLLLGTTGEGPSFSPEERVDILRSAQRIRSTFPEFKLLAGTGTPSLTETIALTRSAFDLGYDGVVVLPPYYFRKVTDDALFDYFNDLILRAVPADRYILGYHIPGLTGIGFSPDLIQRLKDSFPSQFAGIKDSSHDEDFAKMLGQRFGSDLLVLTGTDSFVQLSIKNHAEGCITAPANLISPRLREIWDAVARGEDISERQVHITQIRHFLEQYPPFPPTLKVLLAKQYGFPHWRVRPPLEDILPDKAERLFGDYQVISQ